MNKKIFLLSGLFCLLSPSPSFCDILELTSGQKIEGTIVNQTESFVEIDIGFGTPVEFQLDQIARIIESGDAPSMEPLSSSPGEAAGLSRPVSGQQKKSDELENQGLQLISDGKMEEGLSLMRQAIETDPQASRYLNYASILSGNGVQAFKSGDKDKARIIFTEVEQKLLKSIELFNPQEATFISQAWYLLGEIYFNAYNDPQKAKEFYDKAISYYEHPGALKALEGYASP